MIKAAIEKILELQRPTAVDVDGRSYATVKVEGVKPPLAQPVRLHTLEGLSDWFKAELGGGDCNHMIHVVTPEMVEVLAPIDQKWRTREIPAVAEMLPYTGYPFGEFIEIEAAIIALQSKFVDTLARKALIDAIAKVGASDVVTAEDDGSAQTVTAKNEIGRLGQKKIDPIVTLAPYRTFREVVQPSSKFLLRFRSSGGGLPQVALFEADGGEWRNEAVRSVAAYLSERCGEENVIA